MHDSGERRDLRLDACRGLALWLIFIDHIPGNSLAWLTPRNFGFSDMSEVFVFVSGYTCMLAYGGALREQGWLTITTRALRRAWEIYAAFLLLLIVYFIVIWTVGGDSRYLDETNTRVFFENPGLTLVHAAILQYTPVNTDILPTFVLLHLTFPVVLWLLICSATAALAISFLFYLMVQMFGWNLPGMANRRTVLQSAGLADLVCVRRLVCERGHPPAQDYREVARSVGVGFALSRLQPHYCLELAD